MKIIYTPEAQSFFSPDVCPYGNPAPQLVPFMVRMSQAIRLYQPDQRRGVIVQVSEPLYEAWSVIHRLMRPYFFRPFELVDDREGMEIPVSEINIHVHSSMLFCLDMVEDLDRLAALLRHYEADEASDKIYECWRALQRVMDRSGRLEHRLRSQQGIRVS